LIRIETPVPLGIGEIDNQEERQSKADNNGEKHECRFSSAQMHPFVNDGVVDHSVVGQSYPFEEVLQRQDDSIV
jgi:hypothetical protein